MSFVRLLLIGVLSFSFTAFAQENSDVLDAADINESKAQIEIEQQEVKKEKDSSQEVASDDEPNKNVEKLEVTGSYIKRIDVEGPSPVVTFQKEDFEVAGTDTVSDYLKESPLFTGSTDGGDRDGYFRFRGQHAGSTLVLINGMRVPKLGGPGKGFYSGVEAIPTNIINRVEILKDGSSALYGSDALAGVINFITKKDYDGVEYSTRVNIPEINQGLQQNHTLAFGKSYASGNWFLSTQFVEQRGYTQADIGSYYPNGAAAPSSINSLRFRDGSGERQTLESKAACPGGAEDCERDERALQYSREPRQNIGTLLSGQYDISSDISIAMVGMYNRRTRTSFRMPNDVNLDRGNNFSLKAGQIGSNSLSQKLSGAQQIDGRLDALDEIGLAQEDILQNSYSAQTKIEGFVGDTWSWNVSGSYGYSVEERDRVNGTVSLPGVVGLIENGYDPLALGQNNNAFDSVAVRGTEAYIASQTTARFLTTGELFEMSDLYGAGGPVSLAVGMEGQWENTKDAHDQILIDTETNDPLGALQSGNRSVNSIFAEIVAYPLESLEVQLAGRYDNYSDFGDTFNPKLSMGFRPSNKMLVRSSIGTNFNAPSVRNMIYQPRTSKQRFDIPDGQGGSDSIFIDTTRYRADLVPETGVNYNFGTVIQPNKMWTFTFDQWNFEGQNTLANLRTSGFGSYSDMIDSIGFEGLEAAGVRFERDANGEIVRAFAPQVANTGTKTIRGIDIGVNFNNPIKIFGRVLKAGFKMDHTHMLVYENKRTQFSPIENYTDLEWKNTMSFSVKTTDHGYRFAARTVGANTTSREQTRTHTEYDFNYNYSLPWWSARVSLGVKNLLNDRPPFDPDNDFVRIDGGFNGNAFNALGRRYYVGYSQTF